jgi:hypothetical protein
MLKRKRVSDSDVLKLATQLLDHLKASRNEQTGQRHSIVSLQSQVTTLSLTIQEMQKVLHEHAVRINTLTPPVTLNDFPMQVPGQSTLDKWEEIQDGENRD